MEFLVELVLQLLVELLTNLAGRPFRSRSSPPILIALGYGTLGAAVGLVSVIFWPTSASSPLALRLLTLILVPLLTGLAFAALGAWRRRRGHEPDRLERFFYAWLFAVAIALVRFIWAK
jgi:hypothetical protein